MVAKTEDVFLRLHALFLRRRFARGRGNLLLVPHITPVFAPPLPTAGAAARDVVVHFAGASQNKNTAANCIAAAALVRAHPALLGGGLIIKCSHGGAECRVCDPGHWPAARDRRAFQAQQAQYAVERGELTEAGKATLYRRCRLAMCASAAEGFGHYILEAAAHGCQVRVSTRGRPQQAVHCDFARPPAL